MRDPLREFGSMRDLADMEADVIRNGGNLDVRFDLPRRKSRKPQKGKA